MKQKFFLKHWWENQLKYCSLAQRFFLFLNLSNQFPATLNIEPTNLCNLNCVFCPIRKTNRSSGLLAWGFYRKIIDQIPKKKLKILWLNKDGEPLLHPQIDQMIEYAKRKKVADRVEIYTNGLKLTQEMALKLIKAGLDSLVVSLDAVNRESFKRLKKKDVYNEVVANIHQFLKSRSRLKVSRPLLSVKTVDFGNDEETRKFRKLWQNKADCVLVQPLHGWEGSIKMSNVKCQMSNVRRYPCNLPWLAPAVNWDGKVTSCCVNFKENELMMGDLKSQSLTRVWQGERFRKLRQAHLKQDFSQFPTCSGCSYWQQLPNMSFWLRRIGIY